MLQLKRMLTEGALTPKLQREIQADLRAVLQYYIRTTKKDYNQLIEQLERVQEAPDCLKRAANYADWLLGKLLMMLDAEYEIAVSDLLKNREAVYSLLLEEPETAVATGEYITPAVWSKLGWSYIEKLFNPVINDALVWNPCCGNGSLMHDSCIPNERMYLSTIANEDVKVVKHAFKRAKAFTLDFLDALDMDLDNMLFTEQLPVDLQEALKTNAPLIFYMNPPYSSIGLQKTDLAQHMHAMVPSIQGEDNLTYRVLYRLCLLKDLFNHTNMYIGVFTPLTWLLDSKFAGFRRHFEDRFSFMGGFAFPSADFAGLDDVHTIGASFWCAADASTQPKQIAADVVLKDAGVESLANTRDYVFDTYIKTNHGAHEKQGTYCLRTNAASMSGWCKASGAARTDTAGILDMTSLPYQKATGRNFDFGKTQLVSADTLGFMVNSDKLISGKSKLLFNFPVKDSLAITPDNFWRCMVSMGVRIAFSEETHPQYKTQTMMEPDINIDGWNSFAADCLALVLYHDFGANTSYREGTIECEKTAAALKQKEADKSLNITSQLIHPLCTRNNALFPLSKEFLRTLIKDDKLLEDMNNNYYDNSFILAHIKQASPLMTTPEVREFVRYCNQLLQKTLVDDNRACTGYAKGTMAYDASFTQAVFDAAPSCISKAELREYKKHFSAAKASVRKRADKFGILVPLM